MSVTFFYAAEIESKDLDGSTQYSADFLSLHKHHYLSLDKYKRIILSIQIYNEKEMTYTINENSQFIEDDDITGTNYYQLVKSNLQFRQLRIQLPFNDQLKTVTYTLEVYSEKNVQLFRIGEFTYNVVQEGGDNYTVDY